ncbi:MAG: hypothetical protein QW088_07445 [Desulfurococcaceae archaeon]
MPKVPEGKIGVYIYLDKEIYMKLWDYIKETYPGSVYGALSREIQRAVAHWLGLEGGESGTHTHSSRASSNACGVKAVQTQVSQANSSSSRTMRNLREIVRRILSESTKEIPQTRVERIITEVAGGDRRTLNRYIRELQGFSVLAPSRRIRGSEKVIFEVNLVEAEKFIEAEKFTGVH